MCMAETCWKRACHRCYRRSERFMQLHLQEATLGDDLPGEVRAFAMKKCRRHRGSRRMCKIR